MRPVEVWKIYDPFGVWIGNIHSVKLDSPPGTVRFVCASIFDLPDGQIILPWKTLTLDRDRGVFFTPLTVLQMRTCPRFSDDMSAEEVERLLLRHYRECLAPSELLGL
jgi:hypothetical protein